MLILILSLLINLNFAQSTVINKITIRGNKKISSEAIKAKIVHKKGEKIRSGLMKEEIHRIPS